MREIYKFKKSKTKIEILKNSKEQNKSGAKMRIFFRGHSQIRTKMNAQ
jgi:hypothetical protein